MIADTETIVIDDIKNRQQFGISKYNTTVANNPLNHRQWLQHAYEECLDLAIYLKRAMQELDDQKNNTYYSLAQIQASWAQDTDAMDNNNENG